MREAGRPLADFEFEEVTIRTKSADAPAGSGVITQDGRAYVGCTESSLGRRLREMRGLGRVSSKKREGKQFKEYSLVSALVGAGA